MDIKAIDKAKSRLRVAEKAVRELVESTKYETFQDTWYTFLHAAKTVYTVLEQGAKITPQSRQWFGNVQKFRRNDELLQYLYEARNDEEHGLENSTEYVPGSLSIGKAEKGFSNSIRFNGTIGPGGSLQVESLDGKPVLIEQTLPHARLISVNARGNRKLLPPTIHKGSALRDASPIAVAKLGLSYLSEIVKDAESRV